MDPNPQSNLEFETLITDLTRTTNKEQCSQAESLFKLWKQTDPVTVVAELLHLLEHSPHLDVRAKSAILLRNTLVQKPSEIPPPLWISLTEGSWVKNGLLNCVRNEQNEPIINILGNTISMLAADNRWPEIMDFMFDGFANVDIWLKKSALHIFATLGEQYVKYYLVGRKTDLHTVFMECLEIGDLRITALSAVIKFIQCSEYSDRRSFKDLRPLMFDCVTEASNEATAQEALVLLIELARTKWTFFTNRGWPKFLDIAERFEGTRHLVIEVLITAVEEDKCDWEDRKDRNLFINRLCAILMRMLLSDIEDEAAWYSAENEDEDAGRSSNYIFRKQCLHRLATALGGNTILPVVYKYLFAPNHEWQKHLAGLVALAQIAERFKKPMTIQKLEQLVTRVLNSIESHPDHPRVRLSAINVTAQLFADLDRNLESAYHRHVLPALVKAMRVDPDSRVRLAAINVTAQFFADLDPDFDRRVLLLPALDKAMRVDTDSSVRLAAINATAQLVKAMLVDPDSCVRLDAINVTAQLSADLNPDFKFEYHRRVLPALGDAMCEDPDSHVRLAAINVTAQLSADLDPDLQFEYHGLLLPALAGAMCENPDSRVRLAAINVTVQLFANLDPEELPLTEEYHLSVLYALHGAICEFEDLLVQERAVDAMISISINYLPNLISSILVVTVATLREFRRREDIASDQTRIIAIRNTLIKLESLRF